MFTTDESTKLGPARVTSVSEGIIRVEHEDRCIEAVNAIALPFSPGAGDLVLVIRQGAAAYIIGVLHSEGDFNFSFPAGVNFHAPKGAFNFHSGEAIDMHAPEVKITGGKLTFIARTLNEKVTSAYRWVRDLVQLKAGRSRTTIEGSQYERAERRVIKAKKDVRVDGERINLG